LGITNFLQTGALLRQKGRWTLIAGPFEAREKPNKHEISVFCPDFYNLENSPLWVGSSTFELTSEQVREACQAYLASEKAPSEPLSSWKEPQKSDFAESLRVIQDRISKREIAKAVPVVFARTDEKVTPQQRAQMILHLLNAPETLHVYGFWKDEEGVLGATPEILFSYKNQILETMALAGTCPKSESSNRESLLHDEKEMQEHHFVVEDLVNIFKGEVDIEVEGPQILELPTLYHLKTDIRVRGFQGGDLVGLIKKLHPTPALGVAPRNAGYQWMSVLPGQDDRGRFGGPFAFLSDEGALCLVGIRNIQWNRQSSMIGSGCGVVAASELDREWRELFQKRLSVKKILGLEI
jgi:menaquinone-specific isochorismate synthase